jgi:uncharacterized protein (DUF1499 family)
LVELSGVYSLLLFYNYIVEPFQEASLNTTGTYREFISLPVAGLFVAILSALAAVLAGFGARWGWWHFMTGFLILKWAAVGGMSAAIAMVIGILFFKSRVRSHLVLAVAALVVGLVVAGIPLNWLATARRLPRINDITTDTDNPPPFVSLLPLRKNATSPAAYGGPKIAAQQIRAYPDVKPAVFPLPPDKAFSRALAAAKKMGWRIVDVNPNEGRIEASDTTFWFGFIDDIVVRVRAESGGSRVDVRSLSRVGLSDVGTNARRIERFMKVLKKDIS